MLKVRKQPEKEIVVEVEKKLRIQKWFVLKTHGNIYQMGLPDLYVAHVKYGTRWIETKNPKAYSFTPAQLVTFREMAAAGVGIWVVTDALQVPDILFMPANWHTFLSVFK